MKLKLMAWMCLALVIASMVFSLKVSYDLDRKTERQGCERREAILQGFEIFTDLLVEAGDARPRTPEETEQRRLEVLRFRARLHEELSPLVAGC